MKQIRWIVAAVMIMTMMMLSGCSGLDEGKVNDSVVNDGNGGVLSDIADGVEDGIEHIKDGMDTIEDDMRTDLGTNHNGGTSNGSGSMSGN